MCSRLRIAIAQTLTMVIPANVVLAAESRIPDPSLSSTIPLEIAIPTLVSVDLTLRTGHAGSAQSAVTKIQNLNWKVKLAIVAAAVGIWLLYAYTHTGLAFSSVNGMAVSPSRG